MSLPVRTAITAALAALVLGACASYPSHRADSGYPQSYQDRNYQSDARYQDSYQRDGRYANRCNTCGTVEDINSVWSHGSSSAGGGGIVLGALIGGVVGSNVGSGSGRRAATAAGAVTGALIGNQMEHDRRGQQEYFQIQVRLDDGRWAEVTQRDHYGLRPGDRIVIRNNQVNPWR